MPNKNIQHSAATTTSWFGLFVSVFVISLHVQTGGIFWIFVFGFFALLFTADLGIHYYHNKEH